MHPVPIVYGMTIGEYAMMINGEGWLANKRTCNMWIIPCKNFTHKIKSPFLIRWLHVNLLKNNYPNINNDIRMLLGSNKILIFRRTACFKTRVSTSYSLAST